MFVPDYRLGAGARWHYNLVPLKMRVKDRIPGGEPDLGVSDSFSDGLYTNRCGGGLGISVAWALGADPILLVGYDSQGDRHWYQDDAPPKIDSMDGVRVILDSLSKFTGERVINCSAETALTGFPRGELERELGCLNFN
ncbi:MAG TPA: hypothetical protein VMV78_06565 [Thiobacillus sp.]|nr:hypothetical protein [Thiobacillus sp.]